MAAAGFFCLMCGYYTLRPMREALALEVGVQYNSILFSTVLVCSAALLPIYMPAWLMLQRWDIENGSAFALRDAQGEKPHLTGTLKALR